MLYQIYNLFAKLLLVLLFCEFDENAEQCPLYILINLKYLLKANPIRNTDHLMNLVLLLGYKIL
jgi:hypothetical protein